MRQFTYTITCPEGVHGRPAARLIEAVQALDSAVTLRKGEGSARADRLLALMTLGVSRGDTVTVTLEGGREEENLRTLEEFFQNNL